MNADLETFQTLLANMRQEFLQELPERCDDFERLILRLEASPEDAESFNELFRGVHSLKGSGGTHGLSILSTLCHQLENHLAEANTRRQSPEVFVTRALGYVDLLRRVSRQAEQGVSDYARIEADLYALRQAEFQSVKAGLIAESSLAMAHFYQQALRHMPLRLTVVDSGLVGLERLLHEPFDFIIVGRELRDLNGIAMMSALRASQTRNHKIPALLITSRADAVPEQAEFSAIIARDRNQAGNLVSAVETILASGSKGLSPPSPQGNPDH
jgi:HPt (histidine-containing phosphotransfer) domain-containing protein/CheY-like chemotaxis protein